MRVEYSKARVPPFWDAKTGRRIVNIMRLCQYQFAREPIRSLLIVVGLILIVVSAFADSIGVGHPGFGLKQFSGLVIGVLLSMAGLLKVYLSINKIWARILGVIYLNGILYVGLSPRSFKYTQYKVLLNVSNFSWHDFSINTVGFIPLGYLLMLGFGNGQKDKRGNILKRAIIVAGFGGLISLFLEVSQYYLISGRHSSFIDLIANTIGTLIGIAMYLAVEQERTRKAHEILDSS